MKKNFIEIVEHKSQQLALIIRSDYKSEGIEFFTDKNYSQQLAYMNRPKDYEIEPHYHVHNSREVNFTQEVLYVKSGILRVDFYCEMKNYIVSKLIEKGDVILLSKGGHGFRIIEDAEIIEIKQGPFLGDNDKVRFKGVNEKKVVIS